MLKARIVLVALRRPLWWYRRPTIRRRSRLTEPATPQPAPPNPPTPPAQPTPPTWLLAFDLLLY